MPERLSIFRASSHGGPNGAQPQQHRQQQHQPQEQQQQEQRRNPGAATLGALPAAATPKCWAVVQTPLETLYDDDEEESEDSGYFNQLGTTAITPIYSETERRSSGAAAATEAASGSLPGEKGEGHAAREARGAGGAEAAVAGFGASPGRQHTHSEPHGTMWHFSSRAGVPQQTVTTLGAAAAGSVEATRPAANSPLDSMDSTAAGGARGSGSTSSRRPLLRLKTSSSVPNIQSHFKGRTLLRRPRSRNTSKEESLQRETAFWGGDLFFDANADEQEDQPSSSTSSSKARLTKESYDSALRPSVPAPGAFNSSTSSDVNSRGRISPLVGSLFAGVGEAFSTRVHSCEEGGGAGSAFPSSRLTSAGAAVSGRSSSSLSTQQQQLLTPRSHQQELTVHAERHDWQSLSLIEGSTQQQETPSVLTPQAASEGVSLYCGVSGSQSAGNLAGTPVTVEHNVSKELHRGGVPLLRRSLFHPFRKHVSVSEVVPGGSCPDFRASHNTFGSTPSPAATVERDSRRNSSQQQLLQCATGKAVGAGKCTGAGLPPLPHQQRHSRSGGDLPAAATVIAAVARPPGAANRLTGGTPEAGKPASDERAAATVAVADLCSSSSFHDAASGTARNSEATSAAAMAPPRDPAIREAAEIGVADRAAAAPAEEKMERTHEYKTLTVSHQPLRATLHTKARNTPAAAGAAAAAAMHAAGFAAAPATTISGASSASTLPSVSSAAQAAQQRGFALGEGGQGGAASTGAARGVLPATRAGAGERGLPGALVCACTSVSTVLAAAEDGASATVGSSHSSSNSRCAWVDGGGTAGPAVSPAAVAGPMSSAFADCRSSGNSGSKGTSGGAGMHRSASLSTLSKKLSIRALKLRGSSGSSGSSAPGAAAAAAGASPTATLSSTPASAASSSHSIVSQAVEHAEEGGVVAADFAVKRGVLRQQLQPYPHHQQLQQEGPEEPVHSAVRAFEGLRLSPIRVVPEEDGSQASRDSCSSVGCEKGAASGTGALADGTKGGSSNPGCPR